MAKRRAGSLHAALAAVAPGKPLREGLDRIVKAKMGALLVVGDGPEVLNICSGGFLLDAAFSPQRLSELAKMDGAIILAGDASRIARAKDRKSTRLNSSHPSISYAVFCLKKKKQE